MDTIEIVIFIAAAVVVGGLTLGGVTLGYFLEKWRVDPQEPSAAGEHDDQASPFDRAA